MTVEEAKVILERDYDENIHEEGYKEEFADVLEAEKVAISALEKQSDKNCSKCINKDKCAIHDNFNIDYCSDWSDE